MGLTDPLAWRGISVETTRAFRGSRPELIYLSDDNPDGNV
jgi:hypothetical protein